METSAKKNFVFISYNHKDVKWARWLQKKLEWYRLPTEIHNEFSDSRYIRPVFRDRDTLTSGVLNDALRSHLEASKYLVVLCSPHSAQSEWVSDEIEAFIEMGRLDRIVPFIIDGSPQDYTRSNIAQPLMGECFPLALRQWNMEHPDKNLLGIAVTDDGKTDRQKAFIRLVAHLLGIGFDALWQRHKRYIRRLITSLAIAAVVALALVYWFMIPVKMTVTIKDDPSNLPGMEHGVLNVNGSEYSFSQPDTTIEISTLPGYCRLRTIPISIHTDRFYSNEEKILQVGIGIFQQVQLQLHRDSTFAVFAGKIIDEMGNPVKQAQVSIGDSVILSDDDGRFKVVFSIEDQSEYKKLRIKKEGKREIVRDDECPSNELTYIMHESEEVYPAAY